MAEDVMAVFQQLAASGSDINFLNMFKGVSITFPGKVLEVGSGALRIQADKLQMVCLHKERKTFIQSEYLPSLIQADVHQVDLARCHAILTNLKPIQNGIGNRALVRVQPKEKMECTILNKEDKHFVRGEMVDISQNGLGVFLPAWMFSPRQFSKNTPFIVSMTLPGSFVIYGTVSKSTSDGSIVLDRFSSDNVRYTPSVGRSKRSTSSLSEDTTPTRLVDPQINVDCVVANTTLDDAYSRYRIGYRVQPNDPNRSVITQYISQRQAEIIREIKVMYDVLLKLSIR